MVDDFAILGVAAGADEAAIKRAFRRKVKELHPDLAEGAEALRRHGLFVALCEAYSRLLGKGSGAGARPAPDRAAPPSTSSAANAPASGVVAYADPAYAFYKAGMRIYMSIHPSQWNFDTQRMLNTAIKGSESDQDAIKSRVLELVGLFPKAYYYFGLVLHEYPDSAWAFDAREKMARIEERILLYRRIIESFTTWNGAETGGADDRRDERRAEMEKTNRAMKAARREPRPPR